MYFIIHIPVEEENWNVLLVSYSLVVGEKRTSNWNSEEMNPGCIYLIAT